MSVDKALLDGRLRPGDPGRSDAYLDVPTVQSHASFITTLPDGDLGMVWFGGTQEGVGDISVWFSRLIEDVWTAPVQLSDDAQHSEQNPVLFPTPGGDLWLLWTAQRAGDQDTASVRRRISKDSGQTWGEVETLFPADERSGVFIRQPVVVTESGRWLLGIFRCVKVPGERWSGDADTSSVMLSDDQGTTWREVEVPASVGSVHMNIVDLGGGSLVALYRSRWADHIYLSRSSDDGSSWSAPQPTDLPNNNSSIMQTRLSDGRLALVFNDSSRLDATERRLSLYDEIDENGIVEDAAPAVVEVAEHKAFWGAPRAPMTLALSPDGGESWQRVLNLDEGDGYCLTNNSRDGLNRELSYPAIHQGADGLLHVTYTYHRQTIKHVRLDLSRIGV
ncbi:sialidase family protein [Kineosporia babensis]|uniref:Exo-alpha-sialidase n=1 Tax=Kineosporia babensis TaxID=499548 RepID=A0A9X1NK03_9ACTN|nr:exo-alpha-sialidase [Kineosporia babensis]MCD5315106.1 exo-alpha-sialidase [Kineosporia babensis]